jgi:hypothetical protein
MTEQHRITPPPSLVEQWCREYGIEQLPTLACFIADKAAEWGADQELEACCEWTAANFGELPGQNLHLYRRPKPRSLKQQAQAALLRLANESNDLASEEAADMETIRRALEALPND